MCGDMRVQDVQLSYNLRGVCVVTVHCVTPVTDVSCVLLRRAKSLGVPSKLSKKF
jgi:hypothetical protein